jgi:hypothetical protein
MTLTIITIVMIPVRLILILPFPVWQAFACSVWEGIEQGVCQGGMNAYNVLKSKDN